MNFSALLSNFRHTQIDTTASVVTMTVFKLKMTRICLSFCIVSFCVPAEKRCGQVSPKIVDKIGYV